MSEQIGKQSLVFSNSPYILSASSVVGTKEAEGPLADAFDVISEDDTFGSDSWEEAESVLQKKALNVAIDKAGISPEELRYLFAGDLLGQSVATSFGLQNFEVPLFGLYGACSTAGLSLSLAAMTVAAGYADLAAAVTSSHFASAEKQFRFPLEYANQRPLSTTWTVTGAGAFLLAGGGKYHALMRRGRQENGFVDSDTRQNGKGFADSDTCQNGKGLADDAACQNGKGLADDAACQNGKGLADDAACQNEKRLMDSDACQNEKLFAEDTDDAAYKKWTKSYDIRIPGITTGKIVDYGVRDSMNMGAAMAPAAMDVICAHFDDFSRAPEDYDLIVTGDLGEIGREILIDLMQEKGIDLSANHTDCGITIFDNEKQGTGSGGSGCGCAAVTLAAHFLPKLRSGELKRILYVPTGALLSKISFNEGQNVPGIAHAVVLESSVGA